MQSDNDLFTIKYLSIGPHIYIMKQFENWRCLLWQAQKRSLEQGE